MKYVAHRINKNLSRITPFERHIKHMLMRGYAETVTVVILSHSLQSQSHSLGIAVFTACA
jgi:hypothetical protein